MGDISTADAKSISDIRKSLEIADKFHVDISDEKILKIHKEFIDSKEFLTDQIVEQIDRFESGVIHQINTRIEELESDIIYNLALVNYNEKQEKEIVDEKLKSIQDWAYGLVGDVHQQVDKQRVDLESLFHDTNMVTSKEINSLREAIQNLSKRLSELEKH